MTQQKYYELAQLHEIVNIKIFHIIMKHNYINRKTRFN